MSEEEYRIVLAVDDSPISKKAIDYTIKLCSKLWSPYKLEVLFAVGLNPPSTTLDLLSGLDRMNNIEIQADAKEAVENIKNYMFKFEDFKSFEIVIKEDTKDVEHIIEEYININPPHLLVMGSSNKDGLQKIILGSVSDHCLHKCNCPVTIIKN